MEDESKDGNAITMELPVRLSRAEVFSKGLELAKTNIKAREMEEQRKRDMKRLNEEVKSLELEAEHLARDLKEGQEDREVQCIEKLNYTKGTKDIVRTDTGEVVETHPIDAPLFKKGKTAETAKPAKKRSKKKIPRKTKKVSKRKPATVTNISEGRTS